MTNVQSQIHELVISSITNLSVGQISRTDLIEKIQEVQTGSEDKIEQILIDAVEAYESYPCDAEGLTAQDLKNLCEIDLRTAEKIALLF